MRTIAAPTLRLSGEERGQGNRVRLSDPRSLKEELRVAESEQRMLPGCSWCLGWGKKGSDEAGSGNAQSR